MQINRNFPNESYKWLLQRFIISKKSRTVTDVPNSPKFMFYFINLQWQMKYFVCALIKIR